MYIYIYIYDDLLSDNIDNRGWEIKLYIKCELLNLHDMIRIPENSVSVKIDSRIEPEIDPLLAIAFSVCVHIGLYCVWLPGPIAQELEVQFIANIIRVRVHLEYQKK